MRRGTLLLAATLIGIGVFLLLREAFPSWQRVSGGSVALIAIGGWLLLDRPWLGPRRLGSIMLPLILVAIGGILLLRDLDVVREDFSLWPIALIAIGVAILLTALSERRAVPTTTWALPADGARSASISLRHGAGRLILGPTSDPELLIDGSFTGDVDTKVRRAHDVVEATLRPARRGGRWGPGWRGFDWALSVSRAVPLSLEVKTGGSSARLELEELLVPDLSLDTGASQVEVTMPARGRTVARVRTGAAQVRIRIPPGVAARVRSRGGLSATDVDATRFPRVGDAFQSPEFDAAPNRLELDIESGAADVSVS